MKVLVTGGAGYIGSITARELINAGHEVVILDHFQRHTPEKVSQFESVDVDLTDFEATLTALKDIKPDAVMHFAAYIEMGESVIDPAKYYHNNVLGSFNLAKAMVEIGIDKLVFSSSAGVYGNPERIPVAEDDRKIPTNPYGETKLTVERMLMWFEEPYGLRSISIRYFNAAGATLDGTNGEDHEPESHLIPNVIKSVQEGSEFTLFGGDYKTEDGTCVRDYIHVVDLATAHIKALDALASGAKTTSYNAGTGHGYSNKEIIEMVEKISGHKVNVKIAPRRPGDAAITVADTSRIREELNWEPQHSDLETIVRTAWEWHQKSK